MTRALEHETLARYLMARTNPALLLPTVLHQRPLGLWTSWQRPRARAHLGSCGTVVNLPELERPTNNQQAPEQAVVPIDNGAVKRPLTRRGRAVCMVDPTLIFAVADEVNGEHGTPP